MGDLHQEPGPPGLRHQLRWHLGGTFCPLTDPTTCLWCLHVHHMPPHPPHPQLPAPRGGGTAPHPHHSPQKGAPEEGDMHQEEGEFSAPLQLLGCGEEDGRTSLQLIIFPQPRFQRQRRLCNERCLPSAPTNFWSRRLLRATSEPSGDSATDTSCPWRGDPRGLSSWPPALPSSPGGCQRLNQPCRCHRGGAAGCLELFRSCHLPPRDTDQVSTHPQ